MPDTITLSDMEPEPMGRLTIRGRYRDGRMEAIVRMKTGDWWVEILVDDDHTARYAKEYNLTVEEVGKDEDD